MSIFGRRRQKGTTPGAVYVETVETLDGEVIEFTGATPEEARAKADEFMEWHYG